VSINPVCNPDLVKLTEVFLIPSSFLVAALGTADTNPHRAAVSVIGAVISVLWWLCSREALDEHTAGQPDNAPRAPSRRLRVMSVLPAFFIICWLLSIIGHIMLSNRPPGE
jgi:hypothetical protein